jgi:hypothetical protein
MSDDTRAKNAIRWFASGGDLRTLAQHHPIDKSDTPVETLPFSRDEWLELKDDIELIKQVLVKMVSALDTLTD